MRYAELHCRTNFSFLEGASHAQELVETTAALGYAALAVTDVNSLAGVVRAHGAAKDVGLKLIIGAEITHTWPSLGETRNPESRRDSATPGRASAEALRLRSAACAGRHGQCGLRARAI